MLRPVIVRAYRTDEKRISRSQCFDAIFSLSAEIIWKLFMIKRKLQLLNLTTVLLLLLPVFIISDSLSSSRTQTLKMQGGNSLSRLRFVQLDEAQLLLENFPDCFRKLHFNNRRRRMNNLIW